MPEQKLFIYRNIRGDVNPHDVTVIQSDLIHFGAVHEERGFLTFRHDGVIEYCSSPEELEARFQYYQQNPQPLPEPRILKHRNPNKLPEVCFTGFKVDTKKELVQLAEKSFYIAKGVTQKLDYLVCGFRAGPAKVAKASAQGVSLLTEEEFRHIASDQ